MSPDFPNENDNPDTEDKTVPPYDDRQKSGEVDSQDKSTKEGAKTAGAVGPVADDEMKADQPEDTERGEHASPADEQPASESGGSAEDEGSSSTGAHTTGVPRGEDMPDKERS